MDEKNLIKILQKELIDYDLSVVHDAIALNKFGLLGNGEDFDGWLQTLISTGEDVFSVEVIEDRIEQALSFLQSDMIEWDRES